MELRAAGPRDFSDEEGDGALGKIKMICVDLDGTLLCDDHQTIPAANLEAIREAAQAGVAVVPCTGRIFSRVPASVRAVPQLRYAIVINGAQVLDIWENKVLYSAYLPVETVLRAMDHFAPLQLMPEVYQDDRMLIQKDDLERLLKTGMERAHLEYMLHEERPVEDLRAHLLARPEGLCKLQFPYFESLAQRDAVRAELESWGGLKMSYSMERNLEINDENATKGQAIRALSKALGLGLDEVMAIGDGENDRDMLTTAGCSVAMGNAAPSIRALAAHVTGGNEEGGVAMAIRAALRGGEDGWTG